MIPCGFLRRLAVLSLVSLALGGLFAQSAAAACPNYALGQPFLRWLDVANYTLSPNGGFESGSRAWTLSRGAKVVLGNESFAVRSAGDKYSLSLPSGSSATSSTTCVRLLDPTMRFFVKNSGSLLSTLKVEVLYVDLFGVRRARTIAFLLGTKRWAPTLPLPFLANLENALVIDGGVDVAFRFTPQGSLGAWTIDDVYVDPFKGR